MSVIQIDVKKQDVEYKRSLCRQLEQGNILVLSETPFLPSSEECEFLREQRQSASASHKNIAYKPNLNKMTGANAENEQTAARMETILAAYSRGALAFLSDLFPDYSSTWRVDYASFRPVEEQGRDLPLRHRNDLMHLDAFPTRPTNGGRILRAFTNLHPTRDRVWAITNSFEDLADRYAVAAGLNNVTGPFATTRRQAIRFARLLGAKLPDRSPYDEFMLKFHHYLKSNAEFQQNGRTETAVFPPGATWISFTDQVAHAVVSGQYALEQTCIVPFAAMVHPELAPVTVLQKLARRKLVDGGASSLSAEAQERVHV